MSVQNFQVYLIMFCRRLLDFGSSGERNQNFEDSKMVASMKQLYGLEIMQLRKE